MEEGRKADGLNRLMVGPKPRHHHTTEAAMSRGYLVIADTQRGQITRLFDTLDAAKRAGMKIWMGGLAERVVLLKPRGKSIRIAKDDRCTRRPRYTWTR
jgi:hypothetical protein